MASPQLEGGYSKISNELLEKIIEYPLKGYELKIIFCIIRNTYGWNTSRRQISYGVIAARTGIDRRHLVNYCTSLERRNILFKQKLKNKNNLWGINKDYEQWQKIDGSMFVLEMVEKKIIPVWREMWIKNSFPALTEIIDSEIEIIIKKYGETEFIESLKISAKQNSKKLSYIEGILKRKSTGSSSSNDVTDKVQISDGRWLTDKELAEAEMRGEVRYERNGDKWITK